MKRTIRFALCITFASLFASTAFADYPEHAINVIVPFPPGGSVDPIARAIQGKMEAYLSATVIVLNQAGAGGTLGTAKVAKAAPDGYTLGVTTVGPLTTQPHMTKLSYDVDSFEYVCRTHVTPQVLAVPVDSPYRTLKDLVDDAKKHPTKIIFASTGTGSLPHLAEVEFGKVAGFEWLHVPTKGDSDALGLALSGEITGWVAGVQTVSRLSSRLRALGILEAERSSVLPDIPTFREQGYSVVSTGWGGLIAPKGTPPQIIDKLSQACAEAVTTPSFEAMLNTLQIPQGYLPAKEFNAFVRSEYKRYGALIEMIGAKVK